MTLAVVVSLTLGLCGFISPIITGIVNNHYMLKMRKLELEHENSKNRKTYIRNILEQYLKSAGQMIVYSDNETEKEYGTYYFLALTYVPEDLHPKMVQLNKSISDLDKNTATKLLEELTPSISDLLKKL